MTDQAGRAELRAAAEIEADLLRLTWARTHHIEVDESTDEAVLRLADDVPKFRDRLAAVEADRDDVRALLDDVMALISDAEIVGEWTNSGEANWQRQVVEAKLLPYLDRFTALSGREFVSSCEVVDEDEVIERDQLRVERDTSVARAEAVEADRDRLQGEVERLRQFPYLTGGQWVQGAIYDEARAKLDAATEWLARVDPCPEQNGNQFAELRGILAASRPSSPETDCPGCRWVDPSPEGIAPDGECLLCEGGGDVTLACGHRRRCPRCAGERATPSPDTTEATG